MTDRVVPALLNGRPSAGIDCRDRGLAYGDGVFETLRLNAGRLPLLERHLARLRLGCEWLDISCNEASLRRELQCLLETISGIDRGVIKIIVTRGSGGRGYAAPPELAANRLILFQDWPERPACWWQDGVEVWPCRTRLGLNPGLAGIKHLNRLENVLARLEWRDPGVAEGLLRDIHGNFVEGTASNLFVVSGDRLCTPTLEQCGVKGIVRDLILGDWARKFSAVPRSVEIDEAMLLTADEVFLTNSLIGAWPVVRCAAQSWQPGPVCREVQHSYETLFNA